MLTTVIELSLCIFSFTAGTDLLMLIIQKFVEIWDSLVALTAMKGLRVHLGLEVNIHSSAARSEFLLVICFYIRNGNNKLSWGFVLQVFPCGQRVSWWWKCQTSQGMACFCKMQLGSKFGEIQIIALLCVWEEKTRANKCVTELRCSPLSFSFYCGYPKQCCLPIKAMNWSLQKAVKLFQDCRNFCSVTASRCRAVDRSKTICPCSMAAYTVSNQNANFHQIDVGWKLGGEGMAQRQWQSWEETDLAGPLPVRALPTGRCSFGNDCLVCSWALFYI